MHAARVIATPILTLGLLLDCQKLHQVGHVSVETLAAADERLRICQFKVQRGHNHHGVRPINRLASAVITLISALILSCVLRRLKRVPV